MDAASHRRCPRCDYDLTGLPVEHICPECGFAYDLHSTSIRLTARREYRNAQIVGVFWLAYFVFMWKRGPVGASGWLLTIVIFIFAGIFIFRQRKFPTIAERMIFRRDGFMFYSPSGTTPPVSWSTIRSASCSWWDGKLIIDQTGNQDPISISHRSLGGVRIGKQCAAEIIRLKEIYAPSIMPADDERGQ